MDNYDDIVKKAFTKRSLDSEDWLDPSPRVSENIMSEVLQEKEDDKRRFPFWIFLFMVFLISASFVFYLGYGNKGKLVAEKNATNQSTTIIKNKTIDKKESHVISGEKELSPAVASSQKSVSNQMANTITKGRPENKNVITKTFSDSKSETSVKPVDNVFNLGTNDLSSAVSNRTTSPIEIEGATLIAQNSTKDISQSTIESAVPTIINIAEVDGTELLLNNERAMPLLDLETVVPERKERRFQEVKYFIAANSIIWKDFLNSNYRGALAGAEFNNTYGNGLNIEAGLIGAVNKRIEVGVSFGYSKVQSTSGHNAVLNYNYNEETDHSNNYKDVTLATPYGFVSSDFSISRRAEAEEEVLSLTAYIDSEHTIHQGNINGFVSYAIIDKGKFRIAPEVSAGYAFLFSIQNELNHINTNHNHYDFNGGNIIQNQQSLNKGYWELGLGSQLRYQITEHHGLGLHYRYNASVSPLFVTSDFSSLAAYHKIGLSYLYGF